MGEAAPCVLILALCDGLEDTVKHEIFAAVIFFWTHGKVGLVGGNKVADCVEVLRVMFLLTICINIQNA